METGSTPVSSTKNNPSGAGPETSGPGLVSPHPGQGEEVAESAPATDRTDPAAARTGENTPRTRQKGKPGTNGGKPDANGEAVYCRVSDVRGARNSQIPLK